jgi:hypothetical protein
MKKKLLVACDDDGFGKEIMNLPFASYRESSRWVYLANYANNNSNVSYTAHTQLETFIFIFWKCFFFVYLNEIIHDKNDKDEDAVVAHANENEIEDAKWQLKSLPAGF